MLTIHSPEINALATIILGVLMLLVILVSVSAIIKSRLDKKKEEMTSQVVMQLK